MSDAQVQYYEHTKTIKYEMKQYLYAKFHSTTSDSEHEGRLVEKEAFLSPVSPHLSFSLSIKI